MSLDELKTSFQKLASEAGATIDDTVASISQSFSAFTSNQKPDLEGHADTADKVEPNYELLAALKPLKKLVSEAGAAVNDKTRPRSIATSRSWWGLWAASAQAQRPGPEFWGWCRKRLSGRGSSDFRFGCGRRTCRRWNARRDWGCCSSCRSFKRGRGVGCGPINRKQALRGKGDSLQEALRKRDALLSELHATNSSNHERVNYLSSLVAQLQAAVENLQADMEGEKPHADA